MTDTAPGNSALELRGVTKRYGTGQGGQVTAADDVTFTIEAGAFVALTGASGSGKSTLLHMGLQGWRVKHGAAVLGDQRRIQDPVSSGRGAEQHHGHRSRAEQVRRDHQAPSVPSVSEDTSPDCRQYSVRITI
jgi:ABC-type glutathione transport system ATPase component